MRISLMNLVMVLATVVVLPGCAKEVVEETEYIRAMEENVRELECVVPVNLASGTYDVLYV